MKKMLCLLLLLSLAAAFRVVAKTQADTTTTNNNKWNALPPTTINIEAGKINTTWDYKTDLTYSLNTTFGQWLLRNSYTGSATTSVSNSFRDIEDLLLKYSYPLHKNFFIDALSKVNVLSDRNSMFDNQLQRLSLQTGFTAKLPGNVRTSAWYGAQTNNQADINAAGHLLTGNVNVPQFNAGGAMLAATGTTEWLFLNDGRQTNDIDVTASAQRRYSNTDNISFNVIYKQQQRNFLQALPASIPGNINTYSVETNAEKRLTANVSGHWAPLKSTTLTFDANVERIDVDRSYMYAIAGNDNSKVLKNFIEWNTEMLLATDINLPNALHRLSIKWFDKSENNYSRARHSIEDMELANIQSLETQKDNAQTNVNLLYVLQWQVLTADTIKALLSATKTQYNTPSRLNNDERDEINHIVAAEYIKKMSPVLTLNSKAYYTQRHAVFIHRQRSGQNNWNRVISLTNGVTIKTNDFYYNPQFEVLANYTAYDFDNTNNSARSYSIRYLTYRDSLKMKINTNYWLEAKTSLRTYEQNRLLWQQFGETPLRRNFEINSSAIVKRYIKYTNAKIYAGLGTKIYYLNYGQLTNQGSLVNPNTTLAYAPWLATNGQYGKVNFYAEAWLENRRNMNNKQWIPNFTLKLELNL